MKRAVGYCQNAECDDHLKGCFLLNHGPKFNCPRCRHPGSTEAEHGRFEGNGDIFKEVQVHFNFDSANGIYLEIAIVRDESLPTVSTNTYFLYTPMIKTSVRALKVAESILANLNRYRGLLNTNDNGVPSVTEVVLSLDDTPEEFSRSLGALAKEWEQAGLSERAS